jgi:hypothetical protein
LIEKGSPFGEPFSFVVFVGECLGMILGIILGTFLGRSIMRAKRISPRKSHATPPCLCSTDLLPLTRERVETSPLV